MHAVYILRNATNEYYIGSTSDIKRRIAEHAAHKPGFKLVYYEAYANSVPARRRELKLKLYGSAWRALRKRIQGA